MKRIGFAGILLLLSAITFAQTEKGKFMVSGRSSLDLTYSKTKFEGTNLTQDTYNFTVAPALGYFVIDNLGVSLQTSYGVKDGKTDNQMSQFAIMPGVVYYVPTGSVFRPFVQLGGGYVNISTKTPLASGGKATNSFNGYTWAGGVGIAFFVKKNISLELAGQYASVRTSFSGDSSIQMNIDGFGGSIGFSLFF